MRRAQNPSHPPHPLNPSEPAPAALVHGLDSSRILRILPQRPPFLLIDRVVEVQARKSARALKCVSVNEPACQGQFPATLCLEALSQLMCVLLYISRVLEPRSQRFAFAGIEKAKFRQPVVAGDRMELSIKVVQQRSNVWKCAGSVEVDEVRCVEAELLAAVQDCDE